jgi:hypothetical protein
MIFKDSVSEKYRRSREFFSQLRVTPVTGGLGTG